jgi:ubiquinol-cytochrome c reductase cytochrome b subunit
VTIGSSMADAAPLFGSAANLLLRGGVDIGAGTLLRFYLLHVFALPALTILFISIHYYAVRKQELSPIHELFAPDHPKGWGKPTRRKVPFLPDQVFFEVALVLLLTFAFVAINYFFWDAKLESHANPGVTPQHTKAPWYFLWLQGMLKFGDKLVFGLILGPLVLVLPILLPYLDRNPSRRFADRKVAITSGIIAMIFFGYVTYAGLPAYGIQQSGSQEILTEFVPIEGEGIVDHVPWSALPDTPVIYEVKAQNGVTDSGTITDLNGNTIDPSTLSEETRHLFEEFRAAIQHWVEVDPRFLNPTAKLSIEPWTYVTNAEGQVVNTSDGRPAIAIKKATVVLDFQSTEVKEGNPDPIPLVKEDGTPEISTSEQADFLHRDSHHDQLEEDASAPREASR